MFEPNSRYYQLQRAEFVRPDGEKVTYVLRRFLPQGNALPLLTEHIVVAGDRLDNLSASLLGDPEAFWRIADANNAMHPVELTAEPGILLRVPFPTV